MYKLFKKLKNLNPFSCKQPRAAIDIMDVTDDEYAAWWGKFLIEEQQSRYLKVGAIVFCIDHYNQEWLISCYTEGNDKRKMLSTFGIKNSGKEIALKPVLPNRNQICLVSPPVVLPAGTEIVAYVSSPASIAVSIGTPFLELTKITTEILSDTWDGNPQAGELCYAGFPISLRLEDLPHEATHIITPITIVNNNPASVNLSELKIPTAPLSIYHDAQNRLWTEQLLMTLDDGADSTVVLPNNNKRKELILLSKSANRIKRKFKFFNLFRK